MSQESINMPEVVSRSQTEVLYRAQLGQLSSSSSGQFV